MTQSHNQALAAKMENPEKDVYVSIYSLNACIFLGPGCDARVGPDSTQPAFSFGISARGANIAKTLKLDVREQPCKRFVVCFALGPATPVYSLSSS